MLDTVHFYIHNPVVDVNSGATRYHELIEHVTKKSVQKSSRFSYKEQFEPGVSLRVINGTIYDDTGTVFFHKDNLKVPSFSGDLIFAANYPKERIEINVSVPKFEAGNNVYYMLDFADFSDFDKNYAAVYKMIKFYIRKIIQNLSDNHYHLKVNPFDVSIERIDLCYNLLCRDNAEVIRRIQACNQLNKKRQTDKDTTCVYADETFTVSSSLGWYFKCYNKYKEFKKNDYPKLLKAFPDTMAIDSKGKYYVTALGKANYILEQSKRICRFEIGLRSTYIDHLFWNGIDVKGNHFNLFWKDSATFEEFKKYNYWRHKPPAVDDKDYSTHKYYKKIFQPITHKAMRFHLGEHNNNRVWYKNEFTPDYGFRWNTQLLNNEKSYDPNIMYACWMKFTEMLHAYNPDFKNVKRQVKQYKSKSYIRMKVAALMKKGYSLDECIIKLNIPRSTVYNIKKDFEKKGIDLTSKSIQEVTYELRPVTLLPYLYFKQVNNLMMCQPVANHPQSQKINARI